MELELTLLLSCLVSEVPTGLTVLLKLQHVCESDDLDRARTHGGRWHLERGLQLDFGFIKRFKSGKHLKRWLLSCAQKYCCSNRRLLWHF